MTPRETYEKTADLIDSSVQNFQRKVNAAQRSMYRDILVVINTLDVDEAGNLLSTSENLMKIRDLRAKLRKAIITPQYRKGVQSFLKAFTGLKGKNDTYFNGLGDKAFNANKNVFKDVVRSSQEITANSLLEAGVDEQIIKPVSEILSRNITSGGSLADMSIELRGDILGNSEREGRLARYSKQITTDAINQFNANYNNAVSNDLGYVFYMYQGPIIENSRDYCREMVRRGRWFHIDEIESSASQSWKGKIPGTDSNNILINRGGFNCNHQYIPTATENVPKSVRQRAVSAGLISEADALL